MKKLLKGNGDLKMGKKVWDGEAITREIKKLLPKDKLSEFEINFLGYKLAEAINGNWLKKLLCGSKQDSK